MAVGQDVAVGIDDDSGSKTMFPTLARDLELTQKILVQKIDAGSIHPSVQEDFLPEHAQPAMRKY
jgi:hypothetical protein